MKNLIVPCLKNTFNINGSVLDVDRLKYYAISLIVRMTINNNLNARMHSYEKSKYEFNGKVSAFAGQVR
ncbi:hypothetical protein SOASR014_33460 [Pectobacterium carotovorum subsp. carotovorum]|nr:hypothetical protein SOASR014_33460 [Pectobacterium carotovorum subsp. carotovorum]GLX45811.1 hypothetical protein Pcaca01_34790 [Pectobacterium carotovorum subsp. carotovorum]